MKLKYIAVLVLVIMVVIAAYFFVLLQSKNKTLIKKISEQVYTNQAYGFSVKYSSSIFIKKSATLDLPTVVNETIAGVKLIHEVPIQHCGLSGLPEHCTPTTQNISIGLFPVNINFSVLHKLFKKYTGELFPLEVNGDQGYTFEQGIEGEGIHYYFFPLGRDSSIIITRTYINEEVVMTYRDAPTFIPFNQQKELFEKVLNTLQLPDNDTISIKLYFFNDKLKPINECNETVPVVHVVPKTLQPASAALTALLQGPLLEEISIGYNTQIPEGSKLNSLVIDKGVARADFNDVIERGGGSCHMRALVEQLKQTLRQFTTVREVVLSVNGRTDDIFQP